ncbi:solute carrier family 43 member 3 [Lingula anatina]|uniref:Solute carrier family 43 member 3 n=1 Tax=Lingula anatina TaxID=7574 RepID=A0A1S3JJQ3_LINAN|nr:solute carrier family 43 member 3 [Lingula anatina]|eukprot:XP_013410361.1 solute carrier family 43 member 3 [Lingula anatina]
MPKLTYSSVLKVFAVTLGLLETGLYTVSVTGWPSLVYIFRDAGFHIDLCGANLTTDANWSVSGDSGHQGSPGCPEQEQGLNLVYTVAISLQVVLPALGYFYDHYGVIRTRVLSILFNLSGCFLIAFSEPGLEWLLYPGATLHFLGGGMLMTTDMQLTSLFPAKKSFIATLVSGAADMSNFSFVLVKLAYDAGIPYRLSLIAMGCGTLVIATATTIVLPPRESMLDNDKDRHPDVSDIKCSDSCLVSCSETIYVISPVDSEVSAESSSGTKNKEDAGFWDNPAVEVDPEITDDPGAILTSFTRGDTSDFSNCDKKKNAEISGETALKNGRVDIATITGQEKPSTERVGLSVSKAGQDSATKNEKRLPFSVVLKGAMFWMTQFWFCGNSFLIVSYFGSFNAMIEYRSYGDVNAISHYTNVFGYLQLGISMPLAIFAGHLVNRLHSGEDRIHAEPKTFIGPFLVTCMSGLLLWVTCAVPVLEVHYVAMLLHCVLRTFTYGVHLAFLVYALPHEHFGKVFSIQRAIMTAVTAVQYIMFSWLKNGLNSDPLYFSLTLCGTACATLCLPFYLIRRPAVSQT